MTIRFKSALAAGVSLGVLAAWASSAAAAASSGSVSEVIVTAQRRSESVQDVPMTLQALTGETLQKLNITGINDLLKLTPSVSYGNNGPGQGEIFMRGLSAGYRGNQSSGTIANFPNVAIYLDEQSMQFPARNVDIYMADMDRVEVLEGPQGTLFGGGAEAGALRYITKKPKFNTFEGHAEASYGITEGGAPNNAQSVSINLPLMEDKLAVRAVIYNDHHGGYIDNVPSSFTRANSDLGNFYFNLHPTNGVCPNGLPAGAAGLCTLPTTQQYNNNSTAKKDFNPVDIDGARIQARYQITPDWDVLIAQSYEELEADGLFVEYPNGSDFQPLRPLQVTAFTPSFNKDQYENTAWTLNGKIGPLKAIYTGGYMVRHITEQMDYANYSRTGGGMYYQCTGGSTGWGSAAPVCYSPLGYWHDQIRSTHLSHEVRFSTPDDWRFRAIAGAYWERFKIYDVMNFKYKSIPSCTPPNLSAALAGGPVCIADVRPAAGATTNDPSIRDDSTAFGEDVQRGYDQTAFFASFDYDLIPEVLTLSAGTRHYEYNDFEVGSQYGTGSSCLNVPNGGCTGSLVNIDKANDHTTYKGFKSRVSLTWHVNRDILVYGLFSQGFRPGGYNRSSSAVAPGADGQKQFVKPNSYAPDSLDNFEVGFKSELLDHRLLFNVSAYLMNWKHVQFLFFNPTELGNTTFGVNGPDYRIKGAEIQFVGRPTEQLTIEGSATFNDNKQQTSPCLIGNVAGTAANGKCISQVVQTGVGLVPFVNPFGAPGSTAAFSPKFQGNLRVRYDWDYDAYKPFVSGGVSYTGSMFNQPATYLSGDGILIPNTTFLRYKQDAYTTFDASVGVAKDNWRVTLNGENLGNSHASTFTSSAQFIKSEVPLRPRVITLKVAVDY